MAAIDAEVDYNATSRATMCCLDSRSLQNSQKYGTPTTWPPFIKNWKKAARLSEIVTERVFLQPKLRGFDQP